MKTIIPSLILIFVFILTSSFTSVTFMSDEFLSEEYRCTGTGCIPTTPIANSTATSYSDTNLNASTTCTYTVSAYDAMENISAQSGSASATTQEAFADFTSHKGVYVVHTARPETNFITWAGTTLTNPNIEGYAMKYQWSDLQPAPTTYNWDFMISDIKIAANNNKKTFLWMQTVRHAPEWLYNSPYNVTKFLYKDSVLQSNGSRILQDAQLPLPWDSIYLNQSKDFLTALKNRLMQRGGPNDLTDADYDMILKINIANPGGVRDTFDLPTGKDKPEQEGAIDTRVGPNYVHDYDYEWQKGKYNPDRGNISIDPIITPDVYTDDKLFNACKEIADHTATIFPDKFIGRTVFLKDSFAKATLENFLNYLTQDSIYRDRIVLQDNSLAANGLKTDGEHSGKPTRYTHLEYHRLKHKTLIGFEMLSGSSNPSFNKDGLSFPLRQALINGIDRGADWMQIYVADAKNSALQTDIEYAKNLLKNLSPDETNPTDVAVASAGPGANNGELKIDFIAPGDDYDTKTSQPVGEVSAYIVKYSETPITTSVDFNLASEYAQNWTPTRAGRSEGDGTQIGPAGDPYIYSKILTSLKPGRLYYIAIKAKDDTGKISAGFISGYGVASGTPKGFIKTKDGRFVLDDGTPFYAFGVNYLGHYDRFGNWWNIANDSKDLFDLAVIEQDFALAKKAGLNIFRFPVGRRVFEEIKDSDNFTKLDAIINLAKKYNIYLLITHYNYDSQSANFFSQIIPVQKKIHERYKNESIIFAFDLYPEMHAETNPGFFDIWRPIVGGATNNETLYNFTKPQVDAIRSVDSNHLLTLGYGFMSGQILEYASLPANNLLDYISLHIYNKQEEGTFNLPTSENILQTIQYAEKTNSEGQTLKQLFPNKPVVYEEFGTPNIAWVKDLKQNIIIDPHDTANWEAATWLHLYSQNLHNFGGGNKWQLTDVDGSSPYVEEKGLQHYSFGIYKIPIAAGLAQEPKPVYYAIKAISKYFQANPQPSASLNFTLSPYSVTKITYLFEEPNAFFVSGKNYSSSKLDFSTAEVVTQVFITNTTNEINLQTTASTDVSLNPTLFTSGLDANNIQIISKDEGGTDIAVSFTVSGDKVNFKADAGYEYLISADTTPPSAPTGLVATAISITQINLIWNASTDNVGVAGYRIYRNSAWIDNSTTISYQDTGLAPSTSYSYRVAAYDVAGNVGNQSDSANASTQAASTTTTTTSTTTTSTTTTTTTSTTTTSTTTSTTIPICSVKGDQTPCDGIIDDWELLDYVKLWSQGLVPDFDLLEAIKSWAKV